MIHNPTIDDSLRMALDNEARIDVSNVPDVAVLALPTDVKRTCLAITQRLQDQGIDDDPIVRLKRAVKVRVTMVIDKVKIDE